MSRIHVSLLTPLCVAGLAGCNPPVDGPYAVAILLDMSCSGDQAKGDCNGDARPLRERRCDEMQAMLAAEELAHPGQPMEFLVQQTGDVATANHPLTLLPRQVLGGEPPDFETDEQERARFDAGLHQAYTLCLAGSRMAANSALHVGLTSAAQALQARCRGQDGKTLCKGVALLAATDLYETVQPDLVALLTGKKAKDAVPPVPVAGIDKVRICGLAETAMAYAQPKKGKKSQSTPADLREATWRPLLGASAVLDPVCSRTAAMGGETAVAQQQGK